MNKSKPEPIGMMDDWDGAHMIKRPPTTKEITDKINEIIAYLPVLPDTGECCEECKRPPYTGKTGEAVDHVFLYDEVCADCPCHKKPEPFQAVHDRKLLGKDKPPKWVTGECCEKCKISDLRDCVGCPCHKKPEPTVEKRCCCKQKNGECWHDPCQCGCHRSTQEKDWCRNEEGICTIDGPHICPSERVRPVQVEGWEAEFDKLWKLLGSFVLPATNVKKFIRELLAAQRKAVEEEAYKEGFEAGQKHAFGVDRRRVKEEGRAEAREELRSKWSNELKQIYNGYGGKLGFTLSGLLSLLTTPTEGDN